MKHTFVILAYKKSPYIEKCIKSITSQSVKSNCIISTSTPSNFLSSLAQKYKIKIKINRHPKGIADDWSLGLAVAKTKYVTLAHQDDIYLSNYLEENIKAAKKHPNNIIIFSDYSEIHNNKNMSSNLNLFIKRLMLLPLVFANYCIGKPILKKVLVAFGNPICCPSVMYNKNMIGKFRFDNSFQINMDWKAWYDFTHKRGDFIYINKILVKHRIHKKSQTFSGILTNKRQQEDLRIFSKLWPKPITRLLFIFYKPGYKSNS